MGVTAIKSIANRSHDTTYQVRNLETPDDTGGEGQYIELMAGVSRPIDMWIPWCDNQSDWNRGKRILFDALNTSSPAEASQSEFQRVAQPPSFSVFQSGSYVYFSTDDRFASRLLVSGESTVNGDRSLEITDSGPVLY